MRPHTEAATGKKKKSTTSVQDNEIIGSGLLKNKSSETDFSYCTSKKLFLHMSAQKPGNTAFSLINTETLSKKEKIKSEALK